jgi:MFS family permease
VKTQMVHNPQTSLTKEQKQAVGLLSIGTFLEYFDLMLYVHMAVLLNELFFPETDAFTGSLLAAFAFCSTYVLRPFGALLFGYIGDTIGRKTSLIITTILMSFSCLIMANLPTYESIGITATWIVTLCRIVQGMSSMGEVIGAELYLTEITKPPIQYPTVAFMPIACRLGTTAALLIANFAISVGLNWRFAFWIGSVIAFIGFAARRTLRETPVFADAKRRVINNLKLITDKTNYKKTAMWNKKANFRTICANFALMSCWPIWFYVTYVYSSGILKTEFNYTSGQIVNHNFYVSIISLLHGIIITYLCYKIHPLKILKVQFIIFSILLIPSIYLLYHLTSFYELLIFQLIIIVFGPNSFPADPILFKHIPVFKRFTYSGIIYALSRALMYIITSFGLVYITTYYGHYGLLYIIVPSIIAYYFARNHFEYLEERHDPHEDYASEPIVLA